MADEDKRVTRSQSNSNQTGSYYGLGGLLFGREARRHRSPSPSPAPTPSPKPTTDGQAFFPSPETRSSSAFVESVSTALIPHIQIQQTMADNDTLATLSSALSGLQVSSRKPDLPALDKQNIGIWIRRVESAYIRSGITRAVEKFAFIESKFAVNEDPAVDKFLFGEPTDSNWTNFCEYLKKRYGKTTRQKVTAVLEPSQLDGRTPLQYLARLEQNIDGISLDDIKKEICIRQLPNDIQQLICKSTENMSAEDTMKYAESFYNPDGSRIHKKPPTVNVVRQQQPTAQPTAFTPAFDDDDDDQQHTDVNFIRGRQNNNRGRGGYNNNNNNRSKSRSRPFGNNNSNNGFNASGNGRNNNNNRQQQGNDPALCFYHNMFGEKAKKCDVGCAKSKPGNGQSPRPQ